MQGRSDDSFPAALLRMLEARIAAPAIGIFSLRAGAFRPWAFNPAMRGMREPPSPSSRPVPPELARALAAWMPARLDARALGLEAGFAAVVPVRGAGGAAGFLLALERFGYDVSDPLKATIAFQRRFRPDLIDGIIDGECRAKLLALLLPRPQ